MNFIENGDFFSGFASGFTSSMIASLVGGAGIGFTRGGSLNNFGKSIWSRVAMVASGSLSGGVSAWIAGGDFGQGMKQGLIVALFNEVVHYGQKAFQKGGTVVAGIYGAGGEGASGNPDLEKLVLDKGGRMFTSSFGGGDDEIIDYLAEAYKSGKSIEIYGHSRGGAAAVRIANKLGAMNIYISQITLYDPVGFYFGGDFNFDYPNVMKVTNYYQRNPVDGLFYWADNPFQGSPVSSFYPSPVTEVNNIDLTGHYYQGVLINHINITEYAIKNP